MRERVNLMNEGKRLDDDMFELEFILNSEEPLSLTSWELLNYTDIEIQIQLNFDSPLLVSTGLKPDSIELTMSKFLFLPVYEPYKIVDASMIADDPHNKMKIEASLPMQVQSKSKFI